VEQEEGRGRHGHVGILAPLWSNGHVTGLDQLAPEDVQATCCATLVDEWVRCGLTHAIVSPGSRSTPMALALASDDRIQVEVHHDERSAAFIGLGVGLASGHPALVLTTSGTAAAHLHPAVIEAHQAGVPMIVLTADRPPELQQVGAPQTIDQVRLYGGAVRWFADPGVPDAASGGTWRSLAARAVAEATTGAGGPGPVHLNLAFREPLVGTAGPVPPGRSEGARWHTTVGRRSAIDRSGTARLAQLLDADRGVVVAGAGAGDPEVLARLSAATGWPLLADPRSGCRTAAVAAAGGTVVAAFDALLRDPVVAATVRPEVVLVLGAPPASKVLARWMADADATVVAVEADGRWFDPDHRAAHVLHADPTAVASALAQLVGGRGPGGAWAQRWADLEEAAQGAIDDVLATEDLPTEPGVARALLPALPPGATVVVSSSMPVRDLEWYGAPASEVRVLANRGANGIDGVVSTAIGVALVGARTNAATAVVVGDVALLHDAGALLGLVARQLDLTIVVVDNDGGGIFSFLPQASALDAERFEQLFGTPHGVDLSVLAAAHGVVTVEPAGAADVATAIAACSTAGGTQLLRVGTDRARNVAHHDAIHRGVAAAAAEVLARA
jgi:2-succinyl-5-enolpyruvyl-6-hydroxy-3-cyclohexene-1-carboxylate synthase